MHPLTTEIIDLMTSERNVEKAEKMSAYMKNHFPFLGISAVERKKIVKEVLKSSKTWELETLYQVFFELYQQEEREFQYVAGDLLELNIKRIPDNFEAIYPYFKFFKEKSWWDSVDQLRKPIGLWTKRNIPSEMERVMSYFLTSENMWDRRVAITLQLQWKEMTQVEWLVKAVEQNEADGEFFIQKGIGWALREYGKTDPEWARTFIGAHSEVLSGLAVREGLKHL